MELLNERADPYGIAADGDGAGSRDNGDADSESWRALEASLAEAGFDMSLNVVGSDDLQAPSDDGQPENQEDLESPDGEDATLELSMDDGPEDEDPDSKLADDEDNEK